MKRVLALILLTIIFIQSTSQLWITASFFANRDFIARVLCINKDEPSSACKGACQLKKQIEKDKEHQERSNVDAKAKEVLIFLVLEVRQLLSIPEFERTEKSFQNTYFNTDLPQGFSNSIFHPPAFIV